jgi:IS30 family transposase
MISALRMQGVHAAEIARNLGGHRSTICREVQRNASRWDGRYRPSKAVECTRGRRIRSRKTSQFVPDAWSQVVVLLRQDFSPEQISGYLCAPQVSSISPETSYRHVREDRRRGGRL